jgi:hypothetical protein
MYQRSIIYTWWCSQSWNTKSDAIIRWKFWGLGKGINILYMEETHESIKASRWILVAGLKGCLWWTIPSCDLSHNEPAQFGEGDALPVLGLCLKKYWQLLLFHYWSSKLPLMGLINLLKRLDRMEETLDYTGTRGTAIRGPS